MTDLDDRAAFEEKKRVQALALGRDRRTFEAAVDVLHAADRYDYPYLWSWMGVPIIQLPADIIATQEIIWATKPDLIVETGVARGGSVLFMASILELIGKGKVVGIDIDILPIAPDDPRMARLRRLVPDFTQNTLDRYAIEDPDRDPSSWMSFYPNYYIFKDPDGAGKRELYREYLALMYEYALRRDRSGLLATLEEPTLGNPIGVQRSGRLISQDLVNSVRERNSIIGVMEANTDAHFTLAELGAGYGRLGYVLLKTTKCRYFVFDIPPALYVSQWYLTTLFPKRRVFRFRRFDTFKEIESELSQSDLAFFTPNQLTKFPAGYFDLFANISSIHEMRRDQIKHYMELMGRTTKSALYLKQQKDYVNPVDNLVIGRNDYPLPSGWAPGVDRFDLINPGFFERIYRRGRPTDVGNPDTGSGG